MTAPAPASTPPARRAWAPWAGLAAILCAVFALYRPALAYPFLDLDDLYGVVENPGIRDLSWHGVRFLFLDDARDIRWFPLAYLSFAVDFARAGLDAAAFHATNLGLHLANVALVFVLIRRLSGDALVAGVASLLFGIHPLQVESVAWVSSRKNVLFLFFFLLSALSYLRHAERREAGHGGAPLALAASVGLFGLALCAKATAATLPAVLVLVDHRVARELPRSPWRFLARSLPSKLLYLPFVGLAWAMTSRLAARSPFTREWSFDALDRAAIAGHNLFFYLAEAVAPVRLGVFRPLPDDAGPLPLHFYLYALAALVLLAVGVASYRRQRDLVFGIGWYFATILPMALASLIFGGLPILAADRYFYQSAIGPFFLAGVGASALWRRSARRPAAVRAALASIAVLVAAALLHDAAEHRRSFRGTIPLYEQAVRAWPSDAFAYRLAIAQADAGHMGEAFDALALAERAPHRVFFTRLFVHQWRIADLYRLAGDDARAAEFLARAIDAAPNAFEPATAATPLAWRYLAELWERAGRPVKAAAARERARRARPDRASYFESHFFTTAPEEARAFLERRVAEAPHDAVAWHYLGRWFELHDEPARAREALERARALGFAWPPTAGSPPDA